MNSIEYFLKSIDIQDEINGLKGAVHNLIYMIGAYFRIWDYRIWFETKKN